MLYCFNINTGEMEWANEDEHNVAVLGVDWASKSTVATIDRSGLLYVWK